jgi:hypothetical protein
MWKGKLSNLIHIAWQVHNSTSPLQYKLAMSDDQFIFSSCWLPSLRFDLQTWPVTKLREYKRSLRPQKLLYIYAVICTVSAVLLWHTLQKTVTQQPITASDKIEANTTQHMRLLCYTWWWSTTTIHTYVSSFQMTNYSNTHPRSFFHRAWKYLILL